jgi:hypothetical protein
VIRNIAATAKVSLDPVAGQEAGEPLRERTVEDIKRALEAAGVEFTNGEQPRCENGKKGTDPNHGPLA